MQLMEKCIIYDNIVSLRGWVASTLHSLKDSPEPVHWKGNCNYKESGLDISKGEIQNTKLQVEGRDPKPVWDVAAKSISLSKWNSSWMPWCWRVYMLGSLRVLQAGLRTVQKLWVLYFCTIHMLEPKLSRDLKQVTVIAEMGKSGFWDYRFNQE